MTKELEALQKLRDLVENLTRIDYVPTDLRNEVKELLINSYQESNGYFSQIEQALKRNEPIKPIKQNDSFGLCPICKTDLGRTNYCETCGQHLDWSDK